MFLGLNLIDAHAHLSASWINSVVDEIVRYLGTNGLKHMVLGGIDPEDWMRQLDLSRKYPGFLTTAAGIHPWTVRDAEEDALASMLSQLRALAPRFDLIGEVGFDFFKDNSKEQKLKQLDWCERQLELALQTGKPVVLHVVRGHGQMLRTLKNFKGLKGMIHAFGGSYELAREYTNQGFILSIGRRFFNSQKTSNVAWLKDLPFAVESDAPDYKSQEKDPNKIAQAWMRDLAASAKAISDALGVSPEYVWSQAELSLKNLIPMTKDLILKA
jgi:TatD DNase family protein